MKKRREFLVSAGLFAIWPQSLVQITKRSGSASAMGLSRAGGLTDGNSLFHPDYIIAEPCIGTKDTACVDVCPVDCIHPRKAEADWEKAKQLYIDPDVCIDCGACEPACPVEAIFTSDLVPDQWKQYIKINHDYYKDHTKKKP